MRVLSKQKNSCRSSIARALDPPKLSCTLWITSRTQGHTSLTLHLPESGLELHRQNSIAPFRRRELLARDSGDLSAENQKKLDDRGPNKRIAFALAVP